MKQFETTQIECLQAWTKANALNFVRYFFHNQYKKKFVIGEHHRKVCEAIDKVVSGECRKLIINIAPRYGKTEIVVKQFIAFGLAINPKANFIHLSYSSDLAVENSMAVKDIVSSEEYKRLFGVQIAYGQNRKDKWKTEQGGGLYATSTLGQITGFGAGLVETEPENEEELNEEIDNINTDVFGGAIVIDDPIKPEDALSDVVRERVNRRFETTIRNRCNSRKTPIIIIMQRLHEHDLCGYLQQIEPEEWHVLSLPCITFDESGNEQPLWQFKHTLDELKRIKAANSFVFETQYMQNPRPIEGVMYDSFKTYEYIPKDGKVRAYTDTADQGKDFLCCIVFKDCKEGNFILDVLFTQKAMEYTEQATAEMLTKYRVEEAVIESNNGGRGFARNVERLMREMGNMKTKIKWFTQTHNKAVRIFTHSSDVQNICYFPQNWDTLYPSFYNQLRNYSKQGRNEHDDAPDALTGTIEIRDTRNNNVYELTKYF